MLLGVECGKLCRCPVSKGRLAFLGEGPSCGRPRRPKPSMDGYMDERLMQSSCRTQRLFANLAENNRCGWVAVNCKPVKVSNGNA